MVGERAEPMSAEKPAEQQYLCGSCGAAMPMNANWCSMCGTASGQSNDPTAAWVAAPAQQVPFAPPPQVPFSTPQQMLFPPQQQPFYPAGPAPYAALPSGPSGPQHWPVPQQPAQYVQPITYVQPVFYQPAVQEQGGSHFGGVSLALGIIALVMSILFWILGLVVGIVAVIFGHVAVGRASRSATSQGRGPGIAGLATGYIAIAVSVLVAIFAIALVTSGTTP